MKVSMFEKVALGVLVSAWLVYGVNAIGNLLVHPKPLETTAFPAAGGADKAPAPAAASATPASAPPKAADALAMLASADAASGAKAFKKCKACHSTEKGGKHKLGPNLWDVVGRGKAMASGYTFSPALKGLGGEWTYKDLDGFLAAPKAFAKGTKMSFAGIKKPGARAAIIAYLRTLSDQPKPLP